MGFGFSKMAKSLDKKIVKITTLRDAGFLEVELNNGQTKKRFRRPVDELMESTVSRMKCSLNNQKKKKSKLDKFKKILESEKTNDDTIISILDSDKQEISQTQEALHIWKSAHFLTVNGETYNILFNPPDVTSLTISGKPMVGMPILPLLHFSMAYVHQSSFTWFKSVDRYEEVEKMDCGDSNGESRKRNSSAIEEMESNEIKDGCEWIEISKENIYTPTEKDIDHIIKLEVLPGNETYPSTEQFDGIEVTIAKSGVVCSGPSPCIFDSRHLLTTNYCNEPRKFRMMTYNILADCYANSEFALTSLFAYCPKQYIDMNYRIQLILKEIIGYHGDVICLQEVDRFIFEDFLAPAMSIKNFAAAFANKNNTKEGVALFYNRAKFKLMSVENKVLQESLSKDELNSTLRSFVESSPKLHTRVRSLGSCALFSVLQSIDDPFKYLLVVNTHLYYHPQASNVRLVQVLVILNLMKSKLDALKESLEEDAIISYILCGDFNSKTRTALVEFMLSGKLPYNHADWYSAGIEGFHGTSSSHSHDFHFKSACGFPAYTNYVAGFSDCLDYIFIDADRLKVDRIIDDPDHSLVVQHSALPSVIAPSDHIAQIADLEWT